MNRADAETIRRARFVVLAAFASRSRSLATPLKLILSERRRAGFDDVDQLQLVLFFQSFTQAQQRAFHVSNANLVGVMLVDDLVAFLTQDSFLLNDLAAFNPQRQFLVIQNLYGGLYLFGDQNSFVTDRSRIQDLQDDLRSFGKRRTTTTFGLFVLSPSLFELFSQTTDLRSQALQPFILLHQVQLIVTSLLFELVVPLFDRLTLTLQLAASMFTANCLQFLLGRECQAFGGLQFGLLHCQISMTCGELL